MLDLFYWQGIRRSSVERHQTNAASSVPRATTRSSTSGALNEGCDDHDSLNHRVEAIQGL